MTALIIARPLVLGEDPGLLARPFSDVSSLVLTFLWFVAAAGWALWRACSGQRAWYGGAVEGGLLAVVGLVFLSAGVSAVYKHPAWLIAWEWLALLIAFLLVRQMFRTPGDGQRLLAAILATGISVSAYAIYQHYVELPRQREQLQSNEEILRALREQRLISQDMDASQVEGYKERVEFDHVFGTFAHPNSFAGYLALLFPACVGWALASLRRPHPHTTPETHPSRRMATRAVPLAVCAMLMACALWFTHSRGAILGTLLVGLAILVIQLRHHLLAHKTVLIAVVLLLAAGGLLAYQSLGRAGGVEKSQRSLGLRRDYWIATWRMIWDREHPRFAWLGVGPGNFSRYYQRFMLPTAFEDVKDPHNFALEIWSTCGVFALLALLVALGAFFRTMWVGLRISDFGFRISSSDSHTQHALPPWEFYCGGMAGLLLGFLLWASGQNGVNRADAILLGGIAAGARSVVWFVAFALLERVAWTGPARALALAAGVAALLLNLTVSGGISFPSVALNLWIMMALALNALPTQPAPREPRFWITSMLAPPLLACVAFVYFVVVLLPNADCYAQMQAAREYYLPYRDKLAQGAGKKSLGQRDFESAGSLLNNRILPELKKAVQSDPQDAAPRIELAYWLEQLWVFSRNENDRRQALQEADRAIQLDPEGRDGYLMRYQIHLLSAQQPVSNARDFYRQAATDLQQVVKREPTRAVERFQLAEAYFLAGDSVEGRRQARAALDLDAVSTATARKLTVKQREQAQKWLDEAPS